MITDKKEQQTENKNDTTININEVNENENNEDNENNLTENNNNTETIREEINNSIREINDTNNNQRLLRRGFNIFLLHGLSPAELRNLRVLFHLSAYQQSLLRNEILDWSTEGMFAREERWLMSQFTNNQILNGDESLGINDNEFFPIMNSTNLYENLETNLALIQGIAIGFILNIFTLILLLFYRPKSKKLFGLFLGMFLSILLSLIPFILR